MDEVLAQAETETALSNRDKDSSNPASIEELDAASTLSRLAEINDEENEGSVDIEIVGSHSTIQKKDSDVFDIVGFQESDIRSDELKMSHTFEVIL